MADEKPLRFTEIQAWCQLSGAALTLWEAETLKFLSKAYLHGLCEYSEESATPPIMGEASAKKLQAEYAERRIAQLRTL